MQLPLSSNEAPEIIWRESATSTNTELIQLAQSRELGDFTVLVTANQVAGKGRAGRAWEAPADVSLAISVLLRPQLKGETDFSNLGWLPLLAGLAMSKTVMPLVALAGVRGELGVKWPNDVLINGQKVSGVLTELVPNSLGFAGSPAVVVGAGINILQTQEQLPVETATSLALQGVTLPEALGDKFDLVLSSYLRNLKGLYVLFKAAGLDSDRSGLRQAVKDNCISLNRDVRAILPNEREIVGYAKDIDATGRLILDVAGTDTAVAAGDIVHLRHR